MDINYKYICIYTGPEPGAHPGLQLGQVLCGTVFQLFDMKTLHNPDLTCVWVGHQLIIMIHNHQWSCPESVNLSFRHATLGASAKGGIKCVRE